MCAMRTYISISHFAIKILSIQIKILSINWYAINDVCSVYTALEKTNKLKILQGVVKIYILRLNRDQLRKM